MLTFFERTRPLEIEKGVTGTTSCGLLMYTRRSKECENLVSLLDSLRDV